MAFGYIGRETAFTQPGGMQPYTITTPRRTNVTRTASTAATTAGGVNTATLKAIQKAKAYYEPGGGFGKGTEAGLERGRVKAMASGMQGLVGAGLAGTTMAGTLGKKYEEEVGAPTRLNVEEERARALSGISMQEAGMGFQASQAGLQRGFQAGESATSKSLQRYIADLQASLQREQTASQRSMTMTAPTGGGYARQFPSIYDSGGAGPAAPNVTGGGVDRYAGMTGNLISDVEWGDIQSQADRLRQSW